MTYEQKMTILINAILDESGECVSDCQGSGFSISKTDFINYTRCSRYAALEEVKKAEEIREYANIFAFSWRKRQAGSKKCRGNQIEKNNIGIKAIELV